MIFHSCGTSYDISKLMAGRSGSHLITDLPTRWMEIDVDLAAVLELRQEGRRAIRNSGIVTFARDVKVPGSTNFHTQRQNATLSGKHPRVSSVVTADRRSHRKTRAMTPLI